MHSFIKGNPYSIIVVCSFDSEGHVSIIIENWHCYGKKFKIQMIYNYVFARNGRTA